MQNKHPHEELQKRLNSIDAAIAEHPLKSDPVKRSHAIIESVEDKDKGVVSKKLAEEGLPDMVELGKIQARHSFSLWRLSRKRYKLLKKLGR